jgi:hypothetical protein
MRIARCSQQPIYFHQTRDCAVSDGAVSAMEVATFKNGSRAICQCGAGECSPQDCNGLYVTSSEGHVIAAFPGKNYRAKAKSNGNLCVYQLTPEQTRDARPRLTLRDVNEMGRKAWLRGPIE